MPEWRPGVLEGLLAEIGVAGESHLRAGMLKIASAVEAKAKTELSRTSHTYGTPSPAGRGSPPSLVSGTGRRSIGHQLMPGSLLDVKIGTLAGVYPPKRGKSRSRTPSSRYLLYQEKGRPPHGGAFDHPFLLPSYRSVMSDQVVTWLNAFKIWPHL